MSRVLSLVVVSGLSVNVASAQYAPPPPQPQPYPSQPQPYAPQPYAPQPYAPQPYAPPAYGYQQPTVRLTAEEAALLQRGPISDGAHIGGGLVALGFGFGIGQAIQGRWGDTGWIFTLGDSASIGLMMYGFSQFVDDCFDYESDCSDDNSGVGAVLLGALAFTGFRIWETVDAFVGPSSHNRRYRDLQFRVQGYQPPRWGFYLSPTMDRRASVSGLTLRF